MIRKYIYEGGGGIQVASIKDSEGRRKKDFPYLHPSSVTREIQGLHADPGGKGKRREKKGKERRLFEHLPSTFTRGKRGTGGSTRAEKGKEK